MWEKGTSVSARVDQGEQTLVPVNGELPDIPPVTTPPQMVEEVLHVPPQQHKRRRHAEPPDVLLHRGLALKVRHMGEVAPGHLRGAHEGREDEVADAGGLARVRDGLALCYLGLG